MLIAFEVKDLLLKHRPYMHAAAVGTVMPQAKKKKRRQLQMKSKRKSHKLQKKQKKIRKLQAPHRMLKAVVKKMKAARLMNLLLQVGFPSANHASLFKLLESEIA